MKLKLVPSGWSDYCGWMNDSEPDNHAQDHVSFIDLQHHELMLRLKLWLETGK